MLKQPLVVAMLALAGCAAPSGDRHFALDQTAVRHPFSRIQPQDHITVGYTSQGCFHYLAYRFQFERRDKVQVRITTLWKPRRYLGTVTLSDEDLAGLDRLISYYRTHPEGECTTNDGVDITYRRTSYGVTYGLAEEKYNDMSCQVDETKGVLSLRELAHRVDKSIY